MSGARDGGPVRPMTDQHLERELRTLLAGRRPGPAPLPLRERVLGVTDTAPHVGRGLASNVRPLLGLAAALVVLLGVGAILAWRTALPIQGPAASAAASAPPTAAFDPTLVGPGIVEAPGVAPVQALGLVLFWILILAAIAARRRAGWAFVVAALLLPIAGLGLANVPGPVRGSFSGIGIATERAETPPGFGSHEVLYELAEPRAPYSFAFAVRNDGPLPLRIEGIIDPGGPDTQLPYATALWLDAIPWPGSGGPGRPFTPVDLPPGEELVLHLVGRASPCAVGPTWDPADTQGPETGGYGQSDVTVRFSVLGWPRTADVQLPFDFYEPINVPCPPQP